MSVPHIPAPLLVIEGIDGSGKGTQSRLLFDALQRDGIDCQLFSFPRYEETFFGQRIGDFLNGRFGTLAEADPFLVSLLYAGDRFESKTALEEARQQRRLLICDRYVSSNIGHQAAKRDGDERATLRRWIEQVEFEILGLPRPQRVILLDIPVDQAQELIAHKARRTYTDQAADLQEADRTYMERVRRAYLDLAEDSAEWVVIPVCDGSHPRPIVEIADEVRTITNALLAERSQGH